jgi:hypothetical protein
MGGWENQEPGVRIPAGWAVGDGGWSGGEGTGDVVFNWGSFGEHADRDAAEQGCGEPFWLCAVWGGVGGGDREKDGGVGVWGVVGGVGGVGKGAQAAI